MSLERLDEIRAEVETVMENDELSATDKLDALNALKAEREEIETNLAVSELAASLTEDVEQPEAEASNEDDAADGGDEGDADDAGNESDASSEADEVEVTSEQVAEAVAASGISVDPADVADEYSPAIVAAATGNGMTTGSEMTAGNFAELHRNAIHSTDVRQPFGSIKIFEPGVQSVGEHNSAWDNTAIMASADASPAALTAAACFCGPDEAVKDILDLSQDDRPVQGIFRTVPTSGRFNYVKPLEISDVDSGVSVWTCTDQNGVDPGNSATWKQCVDLSCQPDVLVEPYNIYQCANISVQTQLSNPQLVDNLIKKLGVNYARVAETALLDAIEAASHTYTIDGAALGTESLLSTLEFVGSQLVGPAIFADRHVREGWVAILSPGLKKAIYADQHLRGGKPTRSASDIEAQIMESLGVSRLVNALDTSTVGAASFNSAIASLPAVGPTGEAWVQGTDNVAEHTVHILHPDAFRHGSSDVVEAGFIRDGDLVRQNQVRYFFEGQEFLEQVGNARAYTLRIDACPRGAATAPVAGPDCVPAP